jgi:DNA-binding SARP family transcriptional activator
MSSSPSDPALYLENWPYPVRIHTLGRFELIKGDKPLASTGKIQKKPLEMLKAIIALGGSNVPVEALTDLLWPDAVGDLAHKSFEMTLSRLRRLLGEESLIKYSAGQLSLDPIFCWVDSLDMESIFEKIKRAGADKAVQLCEKAMGLYKGPFLPSDINLSWTASRRETLQNNMLRAIITVGRHYEEIGQWERAVEYYRRGLDADNLAEELYRRLIVCFQKLDNKAEAVKTYNRCRKLFKEHLDIEPSSETEALYLSIKSHG